MSECFSALNLARPRWLIVAAAAAALSGCAGRPPEKRLWAPSRIDGRPASLVVDTGASDFFLWEETARAFGLEVKPPAHATGLPSPRIVAGETGECRLEVRGFAPAKVRFRTVDVASPLRRSTRVEGVIGWWNVRENILRVDAARGHVTVLSRLPRLDDSWICLRFRPEFRVLVVEIPLPDGKGFLFIDSGSEGGLALPESAWLAWKERHPDAPAARESYFSPHVGSVTERECRWAERLSFGKVSFRNLIVTSQHPALEKDVSAWGAEYLGTIGLAAMAGFDWIIDGPGHAVYLRPRAVCIARTPPRAAAGVLSN